MRGSGALQANVDTVIELTRDKTTGIGKIRSSSKFRIGDPAKVEFYYRLKSHSIGADGYGDEISVVLADDRSALDMAIDETDEEAAAPTPPDTPGDKLNAILRVFREYVEAIAADTGEALGEIGLSAKTCA